MTSTEAVLADGLADRYRILGPLGSGGMATVYLADDLRHNRKVAIKVLRPELAAIVGSERFLKEIEVTANLQHPHILGLIDSGEVRGQLYYVMPFVDGETLRQRLERERQLPVEVTAHLISTVADALDYAHRRGVIHRDIKPENILLHDGHALIADFGISLALTQAAGQRLTETGLSLGTPQYMSPEQASGEGNVDGRSDIYSLGCVAYEMLAGASPFAGPTAQAILTAVITTDPTPVRRHRATVPDHVAAAIHTALEKIPADRFATAAEFSEALRRPTARTARRLQSTTGQRMSRFRMGAAAAVAVLAGAGGLAIGRATAGDPPTPAPTRHLDLVLPPSAPVALTGPGPLGIWQLAVALSPMGDKAAYIAARGQTTMLAVRPLDRDTVAVLPGTEGAYHPFFSPDGRWIAFFTGNELRKIQAEGGSPVTLATVERPAGAAWPDPDRILLFQLDGFLQRWISASGGRDSSRALSTPFGAPDLLPGGSWAVGHVSSGQLALLSLEQDTMMAITRRGVIPLDSVQMADLLLGHSPKYVGSGHLVYGSDDGVLMALPFDARTRQVRGQPVPVVSGVRIEEGFGFSQYAVTPDGTLLYIPGRSQLHGQLAVLHPGGGFDTLPLPRGQYTQPRMSPDGTRLAVQVRLPVGGWEVQLVDLATGVPQRIVVEGNHRAYPASWLPDGSGLMIGTFHPVRNVFLGARMYDIATRAWEQLPPLDGSYMTIAPSGREFVYSNWRTGDLFTRPLRGDTTATSIPSRGWAASYSPDGRWLAWGDADGSIAVSSVPPTGQIHHAAERGQQPLWSPDGRRLFYRDGRRYFEVDIETTGGFHTGRPRLLAEGPFIRTFAWNHTLGPDGRLVALVAMPGDGIRELGLITGFDRELARRAPAR